MRDFYEILGVPKNASAEEIKKQYRKLSKQYHPDVGGDESKFKELAGAYDILSDPQKRQQYDNRGQNNINFEFDGFQGFGNFHEEFMRDMFSRFNFNNNANQSRTARVVKGPNIKIDLSYDLKEILHGITKKIKYKRNVQCNDCKGSGALNNNSFETCHNCGGKGKVTTIQHHFGSIFKSVVTCSLCSGEGKLVREKCKNCHGNGIFEKEDIIEINAPAGIREGMTFTIDSNGHFSKGSTVAGDLIITVHEKPHEFFKRIENNIHYDLYISIPDAILGNAEVEMPIIDGKIKIKIEPGTENGKILRLAGKGLPDYNRRTIIGDFFVHINIFIPSNISETEKKLIEKLKEKENFTATEDKTQGMKGYFARMNEFKSLY